jgi:hypothetical protein
MGQYDKYAEILINFGYWYKHKDKTILCKADHPKARPVLIMYIRACAPIFRENVVWDGEHLWRYSQKDRWYKVRRKKVFGDKMWDHIKKTITDNMLG